MGGDTTTPNPWVWHTEDLEFRTLRVSVDWNPNSRVITGITMYRDAGCQFTRLLIGTSLDGNPDNTDKVIDCTGVVGDYKVSPQTLNVLANRGAFHIDDLLTFNITAA